MDEIGKAISNALRTKKITMPQFAGSLGLPKETIHNIVYGKSRKKELLDKIFTALDLINTLDSKTKITNSAPETNLDSYQLAFNTVVKAAKEKNLSLSKMQIDYMVLIMYEFLLKNNHLSDENAGYFCQGMIEHATRSYSRIDKLISKPPLIKE